MSFDANLGASCVFLSVVFNTIPFSRIFALSWPGSDQSPLGSRADPENENALACCRHVGRVLLAV